MNDILAQRDGRIGRITLNRPKALNALTHAMCLAIEELVDAWADAPEVALVVIDASEGRAFCAGGDLATMHAAGVAGDVRPAHAFWRDEYRLNARLARYPKPVISLMHGFTLGGGVGLGCHVSHRIVGETARVGMPECGIGLVPDVGGSLLLGRAPGRIGEYLGLTGLHVNAADAIHAGFADHHVPEEAWPDLRADLARTGDAGLVADAAQTPPWGALAAARPLIDTLFAGKTVTDILGGLQAANGDLAEDARLRILVNSPLSMACTLELIRRARTAGTIEAALAQESRFAWRALTEGDLLEGIRASLIDRDRAPRWRHAQPGEATEAEVAAMLAPIDAPDVAPTRPDAASRRP